MVRPLQWSPPSLAGVRVMHEIRHVAYRYGIGLPLVLLCCGSPASAHSVPQDFSVQLERTHCSPAQA